LHRFDTDHECDGQTDGQTDRQTDRRADDGKDARSILLSRVKTIDCLSTILQWQKCSPLTAQSEQVNQLTNLYR